MRTFFYTTSLWAATAFNMGLVGAWLMSALGTYASSSADRWSSFGLACLAAYGTAGVLCAGGRIVAGDISDGG